MALVKRFDGEWPERFAEQIFDYLSIGPKVLPAASKALERPRMTREDFLELADEFRSPHLWKREGGQWILRHAVWHDAA